VQCGVEAVLDNQVGARRPAHTTGARGTHHEVEDWSLFALLVVLVRYTRHDHFAGSVNTAEDRDELGSLSLRSRVVPCR